MQGTAEIFDGSLTDLFLAIQPVEASRREAMVLIQKHCDHQWKELPHHEGEEDSVQCDKCGLLRLWSPNETIDRQGWE